MYFLFYKYIGICNDHRDYIFNFDLLSFLLGNVDWNK